MKIMTIKMFDRVGDESDFVEINMSDINFIDLWRPTEHSSKIPAYHTPFGSFLALSTLQDISIAYAKYNFKIIDRSTVINSSNIKEIVPEPGGSKVIFKDDSYVNVRAKLYI